jgi:hypothetical protein
LRGIDARQRDVIQDVVNEGLSPYSISALEKDLHLGVILDRLRLGHAELPDLVLCGGTSLVKGHKLIARMSEDMDFKVVIESDFSKSQRSSFLSRLKGQLSTLLAEDGFAVEKVSAHNQNSFFSIELRYSPAFPIEVALRPHILLEFTAESPFSPPVMCQASSLLGLAVPEELRPVSFPCLQIEETVAEKTVAFLRRSRRKGLEPGEPRDSRLVRYLYDIGSIGLNGVEFSKVEAAFMNALERDASKYELGDPEFRANPRMELANAAGNLDASALQVDYETFVKSLVAGPALSFHQAFEQFTSLVRDLLR